MDFKAAQSETLQQAQEKASKKGKEKKKDLPAGVGKVGFIVLLNLD